MPNKKRNAGYDEGVGFDQKPFSSGYQQGTLFRREAPARINRRAEQEHLGPDPDETVYRRDKDTGKPLHPQEEYDLRKLKGRATGLVPEGGYLYHGTAARFTPGKSQVKPGQTPNFAIEGQNWGNGNSKDVNREHAFGTTSLANAYHYAKNAQDMRENGPYANVSRGNARANIYQIRPTGPVSIDPEDDDARHGYKDYDDSDAGEGIQFQSKHPFHVMNKVQFADAQEAYRGYMEDELGHEPGQYKYAPRVSQQELW